MGHLGRHLRHHGCSGLPIQCHPLRQWLRYLPDFSSYAGRVNTQAQDWRHHPSLSFTCLTESYLWRGRSKFSSQSCHRNPHSKWAGTCQPNFLILPAGHPHQMTTIDCRFHLGLATGAMACSRGCYRTRLRECERSCHYH